MTLFWVLTAVMVSIALLLVVPPILGRRQGHIATRSELNVAIHRERFDELEEDRAEGAISEAQYRQARAEMERDLLVDTAGADNSAVDKPRGRWIAPVVAVAIPAMVMAFYLSLGARDLVDGLPESKQAEQDLSVEDMVARLEQRLAKQPDNGEGWQMLGRSYLVMQRFAESVRAFERAYALLGDRADLLADYAEAISLADGGRMTGRPAALVKRALALDANHGKGLWLAGVAAYQGGEAEVAVATWRRLLTLLPEEGDNARMVKSAIARVAGESTASSSPDASSARVVIRVDIASALRSTVAPDAPVFVFARALEGPPAPLAAVRLRVADLPATITLDDTTAMVADRKLSGQQQVVVGARVSRSGNPAAQSGDLQSRPATMAVSRDGQPHDLLIDQQVP